MHTCIHRKKEGPAMRQAEPEEEKHMPAITEFNSRYRSVSVPCVRHIPHQPCPPSLLVLLPSTTTTTDAKHNGLLRAYHPSRGPAPRRRRCPPNRRRPKTYPRLRGNK